MNEVPLPCNKIIYVCVCVYIYTHGYTHTHIHNHTGHNRFLDRFKMRYLCLYCSEMPSKD